MASSKDHSNGPSSSHEGSPQWALLPREPVVAQPPAPYVGGPYRQRPEILNARPTAGGMWHALRRRFGLAIGLGLLTSLIIAVVIWLFVPVRYEAFAVVRISSSNLSTIADPRSNIDFDTYKRTQAEAMRQPRVLMAALQKPEIAALPLIKRQRDAAGWLKDKLLVDFPSNSEFLRVALRGDDPNYLAEIVNAVVDAYMTEVVERDERDLAQVRQSLENKVMQYTEQIKSAKEQIYKNAQQLGTYDSQTARNGLAREQAAYDSLYQRKRDLEQRIFSAEQDIAQAEFETKTNRGIPDAVIDTRIAADPRVMEMEKMMAAKSDKRAGLASTVKRFQSDGEYIQLGQEIASLQNQIDERKGELRNTILETEVQNGTSPQQRVLMHKAKRESLQAQLAQCTTDANEQWEKIQKLNIFSGDLETAKEKLNVTEGTLAKLQSEWELSRINADRPSRVSKYNEAEKPKDNDAMRKYLILLFGVLLGFGAVVAGVSRLEFQTRRVSSAEEMSEGLGLRLMGDLPPLNGTNWQRLFSFGGPSPLVLQGMVAESIDSIRMALVHGAAVEGNRVVMVTSAGEHEGKTTVACNLAASLARSGRRTLLVDGNLRNPSVHPMFELPGDPGFCEMLRGEIDVDGVIVPTRVEGLFVLPAGYCDGGSMQALAKDAAREVFARIRTQFEFVIIDGAPVLTVADALSFGQYADTAILSVRRDVSQIPKVYEACERLRSVGINIMGAVVNGVYEKPSRRMHALAHVQHSEAAPAG